MYRRASVESDRLLVTGQQLFKGGNRRGKIEEECISKIWLPIAWVMAAVRRVACIATKANANIALYGQKAGSIVVDCPQANSINARERSGGDSSSRGDFHSR